jgi:hypothetical protein
MKYKILLLMLVFMSCKEKNKNIYDSDGKLDRKKTFTLYGENPDTLIFKGDTLIFYKPVHDTIFFNDINSVVYIHDTIYKTKVKHDTVFERIYPLEEDSGWIDEMPVIQDSSVFIIDTALIRPTTKPTLVLPRHN